MGAFADGFFEELEKIAALYRPRVEIFPIKDGKVLSGIYPDGSVGVVGGGIDPGEDLPTAAKREAFEESGHKIKNVLHANMAPVKLRFRGVNDKELTRMAQGQRGSITSFVVAQLGARRKRAEGIDTKKSFRNMKLRPLSEVIRRQTQVLAKGNLPYKEIAQKRLQVLKGIQDIVKSMS